MTLRTLVLSSFVLMASAPLAGAGTNVPCGEQGPNSKVRCDTTADTCDLKIGGNWTAGNLNQDGGGVYYCEEETTLASHGSEPRGETLSRVSIPGLDADWRLELADRMARMSPPRRQQALARLEDELGDTLGNCEYWCYVWGPGCPCFDEVDEPQPIVPFLAGLAAGILFDVAQCAIRIEIDGKSLEGSDGFDRLVDCAFGSTGSIAHQDWTPWLNRDDERGSGDFETLRDFVAASQVCAAPTAIECRTRDGGVDWAATGQVYTCDPSVGGVCRNADQSARGCLDYEVRFRCR